jgi:hypothetical protein
VIPREAVITGEDVCRKVSACEMPDVQVPIRIGPGHRYMYSFRHMNPRHSG